MHAHSDPHVVHGSYAAERWANAILTVVHSPDDPNTMRRWGRLAGASRSTLGTWCRAAHASPRGSLELARLLRAIHVTGGDLASLQDAMNIVEPRTVSRLLTRAGLTRTNESSAPLTWRDFLRMQALVRHPTSLATLELFLARDSW
jgi:hypothetical protein